MTFFSRALLVIAIPLTLVSTSALSGKSKKSCEATMESGNTPASQLGLRAGTTVDYLSPDAPDGYVPTHVIRLQLLNRIDKFRMPRKSAAVEVINDEYRVQVTIRLGIPLFKKDIAFTIIGMRRGNHTDPQVYVTRRDPWNFSATSTEQFHFSYFDDEFENLRIVWPDEEERLARTRHILGEAYFAEGGKKEIQFIDNRGLRRSGEIRSIGEDSFLLRDPDQHPHEQRISYADIDPYIIKVVE